HPPLTVSLDYGRNEVLFEPSDGFRNRFWGMTAVDFESTIWERYPRTKRLAEAITRHSWFSRYGISALMRVRDQPDYLTFALPDEWASLRLFFEDAGYAIRLSNDGRYADAVAELVGGMRHMGVLA